ncbi:hypothetical protein CIB48_g850 [Xylaria polymorpha]|nr:hypothetical protein CIB48_g850 [Xylaria polymorpha]
MNVYPGTEADSTTLPDGQGNRKPDESGLISNKLVKLPRWAESMDTANPTMAISREKEHLDRKKQSFNGIPSTYAASKSATDTGDR